MKAKGQIFLCSLARDGSTDYPTDLMLLSCSSAVFQNSAGLRQVQRLVWTNTEVKEFLFQFAVVLVCVLRD